jgi:hypothetical protein
MASSLSSARPEVLPRASRRSRMTPSPHSNNSTNASATSAPTTLPALPVFKNAREAIDEKDALCLCFFEFSHGLEQQPASNLHLNNLALLDVTFNQQRLTGVTLLLAAEEVRTQTAAQAARTACPCRCRGPPVCTPPAASGAERGGGGI